MGLPPRRHDRAKNMVNCWSRVLRGLVRRVCVQQIDVRAAVLSVGTAQFCALACNCSAWPLDVHFVLHCLDGNRLPLCLTFVSACAWVRPGGVRGSCAMRVFACVCVCTCVCGCA